MRVTCSEPDQAFRQRPTAWQRERERGVIQPMEYPREPLWKSFAAALCVAAFVALLIAL